MSTPPKTPAALTVETGGITVSIPIDALKPLIATVAAEMLTQFGNDSRLAFNEIEAAKLIGVPKHVLRDARLRGDVLPHPRRIGRGYRYSRMQLLSLLHGGVISEAEP